MNTPASTQQDILVTQLRDEILDFQNEQLLRVQDIHNREDDANRRIYEARQAKTAYILRSGKQIPFQDKNQDWENDTDAGERVVEKDEFDESKQIIFEFLFKVHTDIRIAITKHEEKICNLQERLNYENMLNLKLKSVLKDITCYAELAGFEAALSTHNKDWEQIFGVAGRDHTSVIMRAVLWIKKAIFAADTEAAAEEAECTFGEGSSVVANENTWDQSTVALSTRGGEGRSFPAAISFVEHTSSNFCSFCQRGGHGSSGEHTMDTCFYCGKWGHAEGACFDLYPELREQYLRGRPAPFCTYCMIKGHWKKFCHILHPELRPKNDGGSKHIKN
jgi:hypothetical protein